MTTAPTTQCFDLVRHFEGLYLNAYLCPAGVLTIGYGHTGPDVHEGLSIGENQADQLLSTDLVHAAASVDRLVTVMIESYERDALTSFVFNLGSGSLQESTLLRDLNAGNRAGAAGEFGKWVHATVGGVKTTLPGLVKRRAAEAALFQNQDWQAALTG